MKNILRDTFGLQEFRPGQEAVIETGRESKRGYAGRVVFIGDVVEEQARAVKVRVEIPNAERRFKPGMFITARLVSRPSGPGVVMVPRDAVMLMDEGQVVFIDRGEVIEPRPVEVGAEAGGWLPVRKGVAAGEKVITEGAFALKAQIVKARLGED